MKIDLAKGFSYLTISAGIFMLMGYVTNIVLGRYLGPREYGVYGVVISLMTLANLILASGIPQVVSKYIAENPEDRNALLANALKMQAAVTVILCIGFILLAVPLSHLLGDSTLKPFIQLSALIFPTYALFAFYTGYYNGLHDFKKQAIINIIYSVVKTVAVIALTVKYGITGAIVGFIVAPILSLVGNFRLPKARASSFPYKKFIALSLPLTSFAFLATLQQSVDLYFVKAMIATPEAAGYYTANQNIARISYYALSAFAVILFPGLTRSIFNKDKEKTRLLITQSLRYVLIFLLPLTAIVASTSRQLLTLLYSSAFAPAALSLSILVFALGCLTVFAVLTSVINAYGKPYLSIVFTTIGVVVTMVCCYMLIPILSIEGAAIAQGIGSSLSLLLAAATVYKYFTYLLPLKSLINITIASIVIFALGKIIVVPMAFLLILYLGLAFFYLLLLHLLKEISQKDIGYFNKISPIRLPVSCFHSL